MSNSKQYILMGEILCTNGMNGEVIVKLTDNFLDKTPKQIFIKMDSDEATMIPYNVEYLKMMISLGSVLKLKEIADVVQANILEGEKVYVDKGMLVQPDIETLVLKARYLKHKRNAPIEVET